MYEYSHNQQKQPNARHHPRPNSTFMRGFVWGV
jgi:hypothetical protein